MMAARRTRVRNRRDLEGLSSEEREERAAALRAVTRMREDPTLSLSAAARIESIRPQSIHRYAGEALERQGSRWSVTAGDRLYRPMYVHSGGATITVDVRGSHKASELSAYHRAVGHYLRTGDDDALSRFTGKSVAGVEYETDLDLLDEMARRGQLDVESIYQLVA
jgi:hypothetical protein